MMKFEILQEMPKCDTETRNWANAVLEEQSCIFQLAWHRVAIIFSLQKMQLSANYNKVQQIEGCLYCDLMFFLFPLIDNIYIYILTSPENEFPLVFDSPSYVFAVSELSPGK